VQVRVEDWAETGSYLGANGDGSHRVYLDGGTVESVWAHQIEDEPAKMRGHEDRVERILAVAARAFIVLLAGVELSFQAYDAVAAAAAKALRRFTRWP
jgi:hypothetical protein